MSGADLDRRRRELDLRHTVPARIAALHELAVDPRTPYAYVGERLQALGAEIIAEDAELRSLLDAAAGAA